MVPKLLVAAMLAGLTLQTGASVAAAESAQPSDSEITSRVMQNLAKSDANVAQRIQVSTENGVVTLRGNVANSDQAARLMMDAKRVPGVARVQNELKVKM